MTAPPNVRPRRARERPPRAFIHALGCNDAMTQSISSTPNCACSMPVLQTRSTEMLTNFRVGDRVEDKETHKRGYVTFVYSELEFKGEVIAVAATKILLFRLIAFSRSYGGTHECQS